MVSFTFLSGLSTTLEFCQLVRGFPSPIFPLLLLNMVFVGITREKKILNCLVNFFRNVFASV